MSSVCMIVLTLAGEVPPQQGDYIGVDRGALLLAEQGIPMRTAIGDFDSVPQESLDLIQAHAREMIRLNPVKDDSDSEAAVRLCAQRYDRMILIGGIGGRIDHELVNLKLVGQYPSRLIMMNETNCIESRDEGIWPIERQGYQYVSFFPLTDAVISLRGFRYPLEQRHMNADALYGLSNELTGDSGELEVHRGRVLLIRSKDAQGGME